jgi:hypothetical protein
MPWIALTEAHLLDRLSGPESAAFRSAALGDGQGDTLPGILAGVTAEVRGYVAGNKANTLEAGATIPEELLDAAMALVVSRLPARLPIKQTEARAEAKRDAIALLRDVAANRFFVPSAQTPAEEQPGAGVEYEGDGGYPTSQSLNGLI